MSTKIQRLIRSITTPTRATDPPADMASSFIFDPTPTDGVRYEVDLLGPFLKGKYLTVSFSQSIFHFHSNYGPNSYEMSTSKSRVDPACLQQTAKIFHFTWNFISSRSSFNFWTTNLQSKSLSNKTFICILNLHFKKTNVTWADKMRLFRWKNQLPPGGAGIDGS